MWTEPLGPGAVVGGSGALAALETHLPDGGRPTRGLVVVDAAVSERARWVEEPLMRAGVAVDRLVLSGGESVKRWDSVERIVTAALADGVRREGFLAAVGGGAVTDAVGFSAAVYLRGVSWLAVPTTLLGQVDAAVGGKTAIDLPAGKNLVGAFHPPNLVIADPRWLDTLPPREWRSGLGEVVKTALLLGGDAWRQAAGLAAPPGGRFQLADLAERATRFKVRVVADDPEERRADGGRSLLNLGHTLGHAVEAAAGMGPLAHGEAVGVGLVAACFLSERMMGLDPAVGEALTGVLRRWDMPTRAPGLDEAAVRRFLAKDKKATSRELPWVLLAAPGQATLSPVPAALLDEVLARALTSGG